MAGIPAYDAPRVVGRVNELRVLRQAVGLRRPVLLLGPPGVSKTTMLRALAAGDQGPAATDPAGDERPPAPRRDSVHWVTGDEQLSAHVLVGTFDPSLVLREGYRAEHFWPGPLVEAMRSGGILYIEELNRAPSGALNVLITALSEGYVEVAHLGRVEASPGFMVVGSANPLDDVGTARLSRGLLDRFLVVDVDYQSRADELEIVRRQVPESAGRRVGLVELAVDLTRRTRGHPEIRQGASVRAAIDLVNLLAGQADQLGERSDPDGTLLRCLVCAALSGRIRLRPTATSSACDLVMELYAATLAGAGVGSLDALLAAEPEPETGPDPDGAATEGEPTGGDRPASDLQEGPAGPGSQSPTRRGPRDELPGLERPGGSGEPGRSRAVPIVTRDRPAPPTGELPDLDAVAADPLADFDQVVARAAELVLRVRGHSALLAQGAEGATLRSRPWRAGEPAELDLVDTLTRYAARGGILRDSDVRVLTRAPEPVDYLVLVDHSGSMVGRKLTLAAILAAVVAELSDAGRARYGVIAFDEQPTSIKELEAERDVAEVIERILRLPEGKATDLSRALQVATELTGELSTASQTILISDCMPTRGATSFAELARLARRVPSLHVCYVDDRTPVIELFGSGTRIDLYEWWARRWVGDDRVYPLGDPEQLDAVVDGLSAPDRHD